MARTRTADDAPASEPALDFPTLPDGSQRRVLRDGRAAFIKVRRDVPADFFRAEARGLRALAAANALRVPQVYACTDIGIALEHIGAGVPTAQQWESAGRNLARQHGHTAAQFGFDHDGYCGDTPQANGWLGDGHVFFAQRRLLPQAQRARDAGRLDAADVQRIERLCDRLPSLLPHAAPALLHGDLWSGNLHACADGELALIDAGAVHYGWAAADLAMLTLFGEPPPAFFDAYDAARGGDDAWRTQAPLLNLYHLLNHLNLFGAGYLGAVRHVLRAYD